MTMATTEPKITSEIIARHGITEAEYGKIVKILGREPNITELGMFSVMWSEHCSYKNSKPVLKIFSNANVEAPLAGAQNKGRGQAPPLLLVQPGEENAGVMDIGDGLAICFKIESHNHPSAIEPFQGAATGVGGILRDIFTMGARPVLLMDSLRFGSLDPHPNPLPKGEGIQKGTSEISTPLPEGERMRKGTSEISTPLPEREGMQKGTSEISTPLPEGEGMQKGTSQISTPRPEGERMRKGTSEISTPRPEGERMQKGKSEISTPLPEGEGRVRATKRLFKGVVAGISHYGNCIGVPTIGGEVYFHPSYEGNPLVNAMCLGLVEKDAIVKGKAAGTGNPVYYVGATTGRDGLGGAAFASRELTEESRADRPAVQVGDPFMEKLLLEACLELIKTDAIVGMQDMGAAGLTCSTCETASRGSTGIEIDLAKVPLRETGMIPYETMLSESQERMLIIAKKGKEKIVEDIFTKWDLHAVQIGEVKEGHLMRVFEAGKLVAEIPAKALADDGPVYVREEKEPAYFKEMRELDLSKINEPKDFNAVLKKLLDHPSIASKAWVWEQYDHMVRTDTVFYPGHDAALVRVKGTNKGIAVSTDCNSLYCYLDPFEGGKIAVAEAGRNVACSGAKPLGVTNCLNFGNPMKPEIFWQFRKCVEGMTAACNAFGTPVTGGNVSFYNENPTGAIYPTPTVGMVGVLEDISKRVPSFFQNEGDIVFLCGETLNEIGASHYLMLEHGLEKGAVPRLDLKKENALQEFLVQAAQSGLFISAHDLSEGGLAVALAESSFAKKIGVVIDHLDLIPLFPQGKGPGEGLRQDALYFGETQSRVVVSVRPKN